jgi:hypothetical protein
MERETFDWWDGHLFLCVWYSLLSTYFIPLTDVLCRESKKKDVEGAGFLLRTKTRTFNVKKILKAFFFIEDEPMNSRENDQNITMAAVRGRQSRS